jgi:adenine-specific DNA-methyltransferase
MDEIFGTGNFVSLITFSKTTGTTGELLAGTADYVLFYAKRIESVKYRQIFNTKELGGDGSSMYAMAELASGTRRRMTAAERDTSDALPLDSKPFRLSDITSPRVRDGRTGYFEVQVKGHAFLPRKGEWKTHLAGINRLVKAQRLDAAGNSPAFVRYMDDFAAFPISNVWGAIAGAADKFYVVQTSPKVIERCMLMCTDPGDLVLDPTCGSGTTAYVAEKWGRRWITCDTSRVAVTLAKQRLMTASFDYFALRYPHEGLKGGFIYKTVPHVTLKSIANNPEIDAIYERLHPGMEAALSGLNAALAAYPPAAPFTITEGLRKGQKLAVGKKGVALLEWEVPFDYPADWPAEAQPLFAAFHSARQKMQAEMDRSIAAQADNETLYDQPEKTKNKLRITGPFTVEAVPFPTVLSLQEHATHVPQGPEANLASSSALADMSVARSGNTSRQHTWRDELLKAGIRGKGGQMLKFAELEVLPGTTCLHASGHLDTGERVVISFGPEHGALEQRQVEHAQREAG